MQKQLPKIEDIMSLSPPRLNERSDVEGFLTHLADTLEEDVLAAHQSRVNAPESFLYGIELAGPDHPPVVTVLTLYCPLHGQFSRSTDLRERVWTIFNTFSSTLPPNRQVDVSDLFAYKFPEDLVDFPHLPRAYLPRPTPAPSSDRVYSLPRTQYLQLHFRPPLVSDETQISPYYTG